jgi:S-formylglutathione hydrolase FrmB
LDVFVVVKIVKGILQSELMRREMPYKVLLPPDFESSTEKYPVLYLLHGLFGSCDNWLEFTKICDYASGRNIIIVMPEGGDGWYTDSARVADDRYESYFTNELVPEMERRFPISRDRKSRGIAGLSMGGYGAFKLALRLPERYLFVASTCGAFEAPLRTDGAAGFDWEILGPSVTRAFGENDSEQRRNGDIFKLVAEAAEKNGEMPYFYLDCSLDDGFLEINRQLAKLLRKHGISHEYRENRGGHDWNYWDGQIERILDVFEEKLFSTE